MIEQIRPVYKCEFCKKTYLSKHFAIQHETRCNSNPNNQRACFGCKHLSAVDYTLYIDHPLGGDIERKVNVLYCSKKDMYLYPPKVEYKRNAFDLGEDANEPMPKECNLFENPTY